MDSQGNIRLSMIETARPPADMPSRLLTSSETAYDYII
jgi:hypothetical protein